MLRVVPAAELLPALAVALDGGPAVVPEVDAQVLAVLRPQEPLEDPDVVLVVPTSGSTGEPKGVLLTAANLRASALATAERLGGHGQWLLAIPPTHVGGLQVLVRSLLAAPATLDLLSGALDGTGPALVPATEPRVLAAVRPDEPLEHDDVALVVPTSGSTGEPKGVLLTAANLRASAVASTARSTRRRTGRRTSRARASPGTRHGPRRPRRSCTPGGWPRRRRPAGRPCRRPPR